MSYADTIQEFDYEPAVPEPAPLVCIHCPEREVVSDGYGGFVHADDNRYACDPRNRRSTMAAPDGHR